MFIDQIKRVNVAFIKVLEVVVSRQSEMLTEHDLGHMIYL